MAYALHADEPVPDELRRVAIERLDHAIDALRTGDDGAQAVHDARKDVKKTRSLLRVARDGLGAAVAGREQDALRAASALLSASRDAEVMAQTVDGLAERFVGRLPHAAFTAAHDAVAGHGPAADPSAREHGAVALEAVRARVQEWPLDACDARTVLDGLERSYRRGRRELQPALSSGDAERLHAWRKRVKDLWYQQRLLVEAWPPVVDAQAEEAHRLTELLGDHHDLSVLRTALLTAGPSADFPERDELVTLIDARGDAVLADALPLGRRVYAERPDAFARRMRRYARSG